MAPAEVKVIVGQETHQQMGYVKVVTLGGRRCWSYGDAVHRGKDWTVVREHGVITEEESLNLYGLTSLVLVVVKELHYM